MLTAKVKFKGINNKEMKFLLDDSSRIFLTGILHALKCIPEFS